MAPRHEQVPVPAGEHPPNDAAEGRGSPREWLDRTLNGDPRERQAVGLVVAATTLVLLEMDVPPTLAKVPYAVGAIEVARNLLRGLARPVEE